MRENKEKKWLNALIQKGTITDKLSGLTILGQSARDDEEGAKAVKQLISMMKRTDRRISGMAMQNLLQLFQVNLLPKNKELSVDDPKDAMIKELYASFIRAVSEKAKDTVLNSKNHAIKTLSEMAIMPEQRLSVLSELVNKLGDNVKSAASLTSHLIIILSKRRPAIKPLIVEEIERLVYRPNISQRAQFYGIVALNGFTLDPAKDASVANQMLKLYFSLFDDIFKRNEARHAAKLEESKKKKKNRWSQTKEHGKRGRKGKLLQKKKEMLDEAESTEQRLLFAVLSGIGRVMNIAGAENAAKFVSHLNSLFRASHSHSFASSLRAMLLLHRLLSVQGILPDRYYNALYEKLSDPEMLVEKSQHPLFLGLVFKSLEADSVDERVCAFIKRLLGVCLVAQPSFVCASLMVVGELCCKRKALLHTMVCEETATTINPALIPHSIAQSLLNKQGSQANGLKINMKGMMIVNPKFLRRDGDAESGNKTEEKWKLLKSKEELEKEKQEKKKEWIEKLYGKKVKDEGGDAEEPKMISFAAPSAPLASSSALLALDDDEDEHFVDAPDIDEEDIEAEIKKREEAASEVSSAKDVSLNSEPKKEKDADKTLSFPSSSPSSGKLPINPLISAGGSSVYNPFKFNPRFSHADLSAFWELQMLSLHYHPSVAFLANKILRMGKHLKKKYDDLRKKSGLIEEEEEEKKEKKEKEKEEAEPEAEEESWEVHYAGDPFYDFSLTAFLTRFAFKRPKMTKEQMVEKEKEQKMMRKKALMESRKGEREEYEDSSAEEEEEEEDEKEKKQMQGDDDAAFKASDLLPSSSSSSTKEAFSSSLYRMGSVAFAEQKEENIAPHERFFFKYFSGNPAVSKKKMKQEEKRKEKEKEKRRSEKMKERGEEDDGFPGFGESEESENGFEDDELDDYLIKLEEQALNKKKDKSQDDNDDEGSDGEEGEGKGKKKRKFDVDEDEDSELEEALKREFANDSDDEEEEDEGNEEDEEDEDGVQVEDPFGEMKKSKKKKRFEEEEEDEDEDEDESEEMEGIDDEMEDEYDDYDNLEDDESLNDMEDEVWSESDEEVKQIEEEEKRKRKGGKSKEYDEDGYGREERTVKRRKMDDDDAQFDRKESRILKKKLPSLVSADDLDDLVESTLHEEKIRQEKRMRERERKQGGKSTSFPMKPKGRVGKRMH